MKRARERERKKERSTLAKNGCPPQIVSLIERIKSLLTTSQFATTASLNTVTALLELLTALLEYLDLFKV